MRIGGIIAEFNPFHNGHAHLCGEARARGATHLVAVMSGNFVQRGDVAIAEKRVRAACALEHGTATEAGGHGVDLILELPTPWAAATAQTFARGAVGLLRDLGCVDILCFGSESGDADALARLAAAVDSSDARARLRALLAGGITFAKARQLAAAGVCGEKTAALLASPNDTLGVEYLRQCHALDWNPEVMAVPRVGTGHDRPPAENAPQQTGDIHAETVASASWLRAQAGHPQVLRRYMPPHAAARLERARGAGLFPAGMERLEGAVLARLRGLSRQELAALPDLSEGLENRLWQAIRDTATLEELAMAVKTKRYTLARVRRLILAAFLRLRRDDGAGLVPYARILACNTRGRDVLRRVGGASALPCDMSPARLARRNDTCARLVQLESACTDLYALALPKPLPCGEEWRGQIERAQS